MIYVIPPAIRAFAALYKYIKKIILHFIFLQHASPCTLSHLLQLWIIITHSFGLHSATTTGVFACLLAGGLVRSYVWKCFSQWRKIWNYANEGVWGRILISLQPFGVGFPFCSWDHHLTYASTLIFVCLPSPSSGK